MKLVFHATDPRYIAMLGKEFGEDPKPSLQGFKLPFAQMQRHGAQAVVWGQIRDGRPGAKRYRLEVLRKNAWKALGTDRRTDASGIFVRTVRLKRGALVRVFSPGQRRYSRQVRLR